jgi:hypothetical protein
VDTDISEKHPASIHPEDESVITSRLNCTVEVISGNGVFVVYFTSLSQSPILASNGEFKRFWKNAAMAY